MPIYLNEKWGPQQPIKIEAEDVGDLTVIKITIDRRDMVARALPEILSRLQAPLPERKTRGPNKPKQEVRADLPGQSFMPGTVEKEKSWAAPQAASVMDLVPLPVPEKNPLHGVAIITRPGETMKKARERVLREVSEKIVPSVLEAVVAPEPAVTA